MKNIGESFVQIPQYLRSVVSDGAYVTYAALLEVAWREGGEHFQTQDKLAEKRGKSDRQIRTHLAELEAVGAITIERRGKRRPNLITINEWAAIYAGDRKSASLHINDEAQSDRKKTSLHIEGDRKSASSMTGRKLPVYKEEEDLQYTTLKQEDDLPVSDEYASTDSEKTEGLASLAVLEEGRGPSSGGGVGRLAYDPDWWVEADTLGFRPGWESLPDAVELAELYGEFYELNPRLARQATEGIAEEHGEDLTAAVEILRALMRSAA